MKKLICVLFTVLLLFAVPFGCGDGSSGTVDFDIMAGIKPGVTPTITEYTSEDIYELSKKTVGEVVTKGKSGSEIALGTVFCIAKDGKFVTNYHVIEDAYSAVITIGSKEYNVSKILACSEDKDLAILKVNNYNGNAVTISKSSIVGGEKVYAVGSSEGFTLSISEGIISSPNRDIEGVKFIQHTSPISHGNSGGPLFNKKGEVIGVNTLTHTEGQNLNFAVNVSEINTLDMSKPLTMAAFYEQNFNVYKKLKDFIISYGTYEYADSEYEYKIYNASTSSFSYYLYYDSADNEIRAQAFWYYNSYSYDLFTFYIDETTYTTGIYKYIFMDDNYDYIQGNITAKTWEYDNTIIGYTSYTFAYSSLYSARRSASTSLDSLLAKLETFLPNYVGITLYDLCFWSF